MSNLARDLAMQGKVGEAEPLARRTLELYRRTAGPEHPQTIENMNVLRDCLSRAPRYADAEELARQILGITRRVFGTDDIRTADTAYELGTLLAIQGKPDEAISVLGDAVQHGLGREKLVAMQTDVDLKSLRSDPGFKTVVADARRRATTASKPE